MTLHEVVLGAFGASDFAMFVSKGEYHRIYVVVAEACVFDLAVAAAECRARFPWLLYDAEFAALSLSELDAVKAACRLGGARAALDLLRLLRPPCEEQPSDPL